MGVLGQNPFGEKLEKYFKGKSVKGRQFLRVEKQRLARVEKDPPWLLVVGRIGVTFSDWGDPS